MKYQQTIFPCSLIDLPHRKYHEVAIGQVLFWCLKVLPLSLFNGPSLRPSTSWSFRVLPWSLLRGASSMWTFEVLLTRAGSWSSFRAKYHLVCHGSSPEPAPWGKYHVNLQGTSQAWSMGEVVRSTMWSMLGLLLALNHRPSLGIT